MPKIRSIIRTGFISVSVLALTSVFPTLTMADDSSDTTTCTAPISSQPGVHIPTGSDASTFQYQCTGQYAGMWTNAYYIFNPTTDNTTPIVPLVYTYNATTGKYTYQHWVFSAATGAYSQVTSSIAEPPAGASVVGGPVITPPVVTDNTSGTTPSGSDTTDAVTPDGTTSSVGDTGPGSTNSLDNTDNNSLNSTNNTNANIANNIGSNATSGNTLVIGNTSGGDATSGETQNEANIVNLLQSSSNALGPNGNVITFTDNINGDVNGNLLLDPATLSDIQPTSTTTDTNTTNNDLTVNNSTNEAINNNITLGAASGNATVADNTSGGNATSGSADNIADVVNLISSAVSSGKSFIGVININGNLNGNILIPPDFANQLLASNVPTVTITAPDSTNTVNNTDNNTTNVTNTNNLGINNNVSGTAKTGNATVSKNTSAGSATTGAATNTITAFNLTGSTVVGANDLLVFVNVSGNWVGMIMNAPAGATAAELGGGITEDNTVNNTTNDTNNTNEQINNNITTNANSGDATVKDNTQGGSATSGDAANAVNLANVEDSSLSLSDWFGILFINVFGTWNGSLEVETATGASVTTVTPAVASSILSHESTFGFVSHPATGSETSDSTGSTTAGTASNTNSVGGTVLADKTVKAKPSVATTQQLQGAHNSLWKTISIVGALVVLYIIADALYTRRHAKPSAKN